MKRDGDITINALWLALIAAVAWALEWFLPARTGGDPVLGAYNFVVQLILVIVSAIISYALAPKPKPPKPASITDFDAPTAEEGREIPVAFGQPWVKGPNVVWYGALRSEPIKKKGGKK